MKRCLHTLFGGMLLMAFSMNIASSQTVSGLITSDTVWTFANSPVTVTGTVTIPLGITLTIEPGVVVYFQLSTGLIVQGKIVAYDVDFTSVNDIPSLAAQRRMSDSPVSLTEAAARAAALPGDWIGIEFHNSGNVNSVFKFVGVYYAGGGANQSSIFYKTGAYAVPIDSCYIYYSGGNGVNTRASSPRIVHSFISNNTGYGVFSDLLSNFSIDSSTISYNTAGGVKIPTNSSPTITESNISNNATGIFVDNGATPVIQNNDIYLNTIGIHFHELSVQPSISYNNIYNNSQFGFLNSGVSTVQAERNYWGDDSGPYHEITNPTGQGDAVSSKVDFVPWKTIAPAKPVKLISGAQTGIFYPDTVYRTTANISIASGATLTILPGTVVKFGPADRLDVAGTLIAAGNADSLIVFTSELDDNYGGDNNGDTTATQPGGGNWDRVNIAAASSNASVVRYCLFKYGGSGSNGNFRIDNSTAWVAHIVSTLSSNFGVVFNNATSTFDSSMVKGNGSYGVYLSTGGSMTLRNIVSDGNLYGLYSNSTMRMFISRSSFSRNSNVGIFVDGSTTTIDVLDSCTISFNGSHGVYNLDAQGPQRFSYNTVEGNNGYGIFVYNTTDTTFFLADTVKNNSLEGIVSSKGHYSSNVITGNSYPIGIVGRAGNVYDGNTISGNIFNNAISIRLSIADLKDTLKNVFPAQITSRTYVVLDNSSNGVAAGTELVIQPGVVIKMYDGMYLLINGNLKAIGTPSDPIVFTSYRDSLHGGKTIALNDFSAPAPNDWQYVQMMNNAGNINSQLDYCEFYYGGRGGVGMLYYNYRTMTYPQTNLTFKYSSSMGVRLYRGIVTFENIVSDSNNTYGLYMYGSNPGADVKIKNSFIRYNKNTGLYSDETSAFREVSNTVVSYNNGHGIFVNSGTIPQTFLGNTIQFNAAEGIRVFNPTLDTNDVQFIGNQILDQGGIGILSTASRFVDNEFRRNRYPIGVWGKLGNVYHDNSMNDGNVIAENFYNNAIVIRNNSLKGTLKNLFPTSMGSVHAYHIDNSLGLGASDTLKIEPGVVIKAEIPLTTTRYYYTIYGTLFAEGTPAQPIIFTSVRDSTAGGNTAGTDTLAPDRGNWYNFDFENGSGNSLVRYCEFRYGGGYYQYQTIYFNYNVQGVVFSNNRIFETNGDGVYIYQTGVTIDSTEITGASRHGIYLTGSAVQGFRLRNSTIHNNTYDGLNASSGANVVEVSNSTFAHNGQNGVRIFQGSAQSKFVNSRFMNNGENGIYFNAVYDAVDTLLLFVGNYIYGNSNVGLVSSRAYVIDDTISGNKYAMQFIGQMSLAGTGNENGFNFSGTYTRGNQFDDVTILEGAIEGKLGYTYPNDAVDPVFLIYNGAQVNSSKRLSIAPGTIIKLINLGANNGRLSVFGTLTAVGTSSKKIVFTSFYDDEYGSDSNNDTSATLPAPLNFAGVYLYSNSDSSMIRHAIIKYGGVNGVGGIYFEYADAYIDSSSLSYNGYYGTYLYYSKPNIIATDIHDQNIGVYAYYSGKTVIQYSNIYKNLDYGLYAYQNSTDTVDARSNFWGDPTGPLVVSGNDQNPGGAGNQIYVYGKVLYRPYLTTRSGYLYGDVSGNGLITAFDAALVLQNVIGQITFTPVQSIVANVSGDTTVSALDASYILRYVVGLITGFPGLGKLSLEAVSASAFDFVIEPKNDQGEFDLVVRLNKPSQIYGIGFSLGFDTTLVAPLSVAKSQNTDSMALAYYFPAGLANVAFAGIKPLNNEGEIARFSFILKDPAKAKESVLFEVKKFILNETDVTDEAGKIVLHVGDVFKLPTSFDIAQNYPNPFNPATTIDYQLPAESNVSIIVYNMLGQVVTTLVDRPQSAGYYSIRWNGSDERNMPVGSGVYFYRIDARDANGERFTRVKKMLLLK